MATLSSTALKVSWLSRYRLSPPTSRFFWRLAVCMASTFGFGGFLALYAMPRILRACTDGDPMGLVGLVLFVLWVETLVDMWQSVRWNLLRLWDNRRTRKPLSIAIRTEERPQI
jgi:hypothetical protein